MKRVMHGRKVLVVLDDVDHIDQLEALAGGPNWFKSGSTIIITTRDEQVLVAHRVKWIFDVNLLSYEEAICLFSRYSFGREVPIQGYGELSEQVVRYAAGLPLTIRVLGSFLCGKDKSEWVDALKRLKTIPLNETLKKLELSYLSLEEDYKEIFLNVACILKGWPIDEAIEALESCGFHAVTGLRVLQQKSLITIFGQYYKYVEMHDHIEEMGKNIVRRTHPHTPMNHSRLWIAQEIKDILANDMGTKATRYIGFRGRNVNLELFMEGLRKMTELSFLYVFPDILDNFERERNYDKVNRYFPNTLQYLHWHNYPFGSLPNTFQGNNLVALKMSQSNLVKLWEGGERKVLNKLKLLDLCLSNLKSLDLGLIPNLETLSLAGCRGLVQIHMPVSLMLISIYLSYSNLKTINLMWVLNLERLDLKNCYNLEELWLPFGCIKLTYLDCSRSRLRSLDIRMALNLERLILDKCHDLVQLEMPDKCLNLRILKLTKSKLRTLDIGLTPNLEDLDLTKCYDLEDLHMADKCEKLTSLTVSHSKLRTLDLRLTPKLENLDLKQCNNLVQLHAPSGCLENCVDLDLSGCLRFADFRFYKRDDTSGSKDESLEFGNLAKLDMTAEALERCPLHPDSNLPAFQFECSYKDNLPSLTRNLETLISVGLCACTNLETFSRSICSLHHLGTLELRGYPEVPKDLDQLECLEYLELSDTMTVPDSICLLKNLKSLKLNHCDLLEKLPKNIGRLECLEELRLSCKKIKHLPDSICMLRNLKSLELHHCMLLEKLPKNIGRLECLEELRLSCKKIKLLPDSFSKLKHLKSLILSDCELLEKLPKNIDRLACLEELDLSYMNIEYLPDSICMLKQLKSLKLNYCKLLENLPEDLGRLKYLEKLALSYIMVKHVPDGICMLKNLKSLKFSDCELLEKLPENIGRLQCLEELDLSYMNIKHLPDSICMFKHLKSLKLSDCDLLENLPEDLGQLQCLEELDLSYMNIKHLPDSICMFKHLKSLKLSDCDLLENLPEDLGQLECLEELSLSCEKIKHLPNSICMLKHLKSLRLDGCKLLEKLPEELGGLKSLWVIDLRECELLGDIPESICKLKRLRRLHTDGTCIRRLPRNIRLLKGLCITGSKEFLESCGFTSEIETWSGVSCCVDV